jgi:hypothetical protein
MRISRVLSVTVIGGLAIASFLKWGDRLFPRSSLSSPIVLAEDITGTTLTSFDDQGRSRILRIDEVRPDPLDKHRETYLYTVLHQSSSDGSWSNLCQPDSTGTAQAIPLSGRWDKTASYINDGSITFACTNGALAKCVRWGYKPWKIVNGESLRDYHQACTRMVRADYCGDGTGHTEDSTLIDVYDRLGIQTPVEDDGLTFEAAWGPEGAMMIHHLRIPGHLDYVQQTCPERLAQFSSLGQEDSRLNPTDEIPSAALLFNDSAEMDIGRSP